jgi:2-oxoglutarate ferredoxin oxidoreductase subunit delta
MMAYQVKIQSRNCKSCELCLPVCPKKILRISSQKNEFGFRVAECVDSSKCIGCLACAQVCPDLAIEITEEGKS